MSDEEKPPAWAIALQQTTTEGFARQDSRADAQDKRLDKIESDVGIAVEDGKANNKRLTELEVRFELSEKRNSMRVKEPSQHDLAAQAAIADEARARAERDEALGKRVETIEGQVGDIHKAVVGVISNPKVRTVGRALFVLASAYLLGKGIKVLP